MIEYNVNQPYTIDGIITPQGDFAKIKGLKPVLYKKIINLLSIRRGTYMDRPELGHRLTDFIGEDLNDVTAQAIKSHIKDVINEFIAEVVVTDVQHVINEVDKSIAIVVMMKVLETGEDIKVGLTIGFESMVVASFALLE